MLARIRSWFIWPLRIITILLVVIIIGFAIPENTVNPVRGATPKDWHPRSFWFFPWGRSGVHKGVDIFASKHTPVLSATDGIVIDTRYRSLGGYTVTILGPKWRIHYYAHMARTDANFADIVHAGTPIGSVGMSGNAMGKSPHLHYSISTLFPYWWLRDNDHYGEQKMWYIDPMPRL